MVILMGAAVGTDQLDAIALNLVDCAQVDAVGADDFHVLFDIGHYL
jgi:hypothetical protein